MERVLTDDKLILSEDEGVRYRMAVIAQYINWILIQGVVKIAFTIHNHGTNNSEFVQAREEEEGEKVPLYEKKVLKQM
jgi:hypothetical protein